MNTAEALIIAVDRLEDILKNDDSQAWKEAAKALPQLHRAVAKAAATPAPTSCAGAGLTDEERADMACAVAAICTGTSSRTVAATAIEWTERALRAKGQVMSALDARQHSTIAARGGPHVG